MCERFYLCHKHLPFQIDALRFFCKYDRHMKMLRRNTCDPDSGCFDRQDLINLFSFKTLLEFASDLIEQINVHLMVQKAVHLQYIPLFDNPVF